MAKKKNQSHQEELELDQAYSELTGYDITSGKIKRTAGPLVVIALLVIVGLAGCAVGLPFLLTDAEPTDPPTTDHTVQTGEANEEAVDGVTAAGVDLSGMTAEEIKTALEPIAELYETESMTVRIGEQTYSLSPVDTHASLDTDAAADAILNADPGEFDLSPYLTLDTAYLQGLVEEWDAQYNIPAEATTWTVLGEMPTLAPTAEEPECQTLVLTKGTPGSILDCDGLYGQILDAYMTRTFEAEAVISEGEPEIFDVVTVYDQYYIAPVDAVMDMTTFEVTAETWGYGFDVETAQAAWDAAANGEEIHIPFFRIAPETTADALSSLLYRDELASYSTKHTSDSNRNNNLKLACKSINGTILFPGQTFSYNGTLGERTAAKGYLAAGAYSNGQVIQEMGGGICQVSSTLYCCVLEADLKVVYRQNHSMTVSYVPLGMDATVDWGNIDFKFQNNTNYPIKILASVSGGYVHIQILGTDEKSYYIEMTNEVVETYNYETVYREMYADNAEGYKDGDVISSPSTGYKVNTYKCKYDKESGALISKTKESTSTYKKRDQVIVRIIERPTEPTEPTIPETEPVTEPTEPVTEPTEPVTEPTEPVTEPTDPVTEPTETTDTTEPAE